MGGMCAATKNREVEPLKSRPKHLHAAGDFEHAGAGGFHSRLVRPRQGHCDIEVLWSGNEEAFEDLEAETMIGVHAEIERGDGGSGGGSQQQSVTDESMERGDGRGGSGQKGLERGSSDALWVSLVMLVPLTEGGGSGAMLQYRIRLDRFGKLAQTTTLHNTAPQLNDQISLDKYGSTK